MTSHATRYSLQEKRDFARNMRRNPTGAEALLWLNIQRQRLGYRFEHQIVIAGFIFDFWCPTVRLVIELDGGIHQEMAANDAEKEHAMDERGIALLRFKNDEVYRSLKVVLATIQRECNERVLKGFASKKNLERRGGEFFPITNRSSSRSQPKLADNSTLAAIRAYAAAPEKLCIATPNSVEATAIKDKIDTLIQSLAISKRMPGSVGNETARRSQR